MYYKWGCAKRWQPYYELNRMSKLDLTLVGTHGEEDEPYIATQRTGTVTKEEASTR